MDPQPAALLPPDVPPLPTCDLHGMSLARVDRDGLLAHLFGSLRAGRGGWLVTANLDILRRHAVDAEARGLYDAADVRVADGMPLVWAARLQGDPLPERVAGSSLLWPLAARAAEEGRSVYLLGGATEEVNQRCREALVQRHPGLVIAGSSPRFSSPPKPDELAPVRAELSARPPDILLVGLGSPKQEQVIRELRPVLPRAWMIGVGISFSFVTGDVRRAPPWMQKAGLEWAHRLAQEPGRLAHRYLVDDLPFAARLLGRALLRRTFAGR
jgi:N-acetylglucosaminyldiphosphoundecaprenol N-acetyl-beta-D-mannosaminyltransferase